MKIILSDFEKELYWNVAAAFLRFLPPLAIGVFIGLSWGRMIWRD